MMGHKFWEGLAKNIGLKIGQIGAPMVKKASAAEADLIPLPDRIVLSEARAAGFFKLASPMGWGLYRVEDIDGGLGSIWSIEKAADGSQFLVKQTDPMGEVMRMKTASADSKKCSRCNGRGGEPGASGEQQPCSSCKGDGKMKSVSAFAVAWSAHSKKTASFPEWGIELENTAWKANDGSGYVFVEGVTEGGSVVGMIQGNLGMFELSETFEMPKEQFMKSFTQINENAKGGERKKRDMSKQPKSALPALEDIKLPGEDEPGATSIIDTRKKKASAACGSCKHSHDGDVCDDCDCRIFVKKASTVYCSETDCKRVAHDTFNGKRYCPKHLPNKKHAAGWEDQWKAFFDEWKKLPDDIRMKAERKCVDERIAQLPEGSDFGSSDKWHTIYGAFSYGHVPGNLLAEVREWLGETGDAGHDTQECQDPQCAKCAQIDPHMGEHGIVGASIKDSDVIIREAAEKCPTCHKPMKENTDGNPKYCQGHD